MKQHNILVFCFPASKAKNRQLFLQQRSIVDVRLGSKYATDFQNNKNPLVIQYLV